MHPFLYFLVQDFKTYTNTEIDFRAGNRCSTIYIFLLTPLTFNVYYTFQSVADQWGYLGFVKFMQK